MKINYQIIEHKPNQNIDFLEFDSSNKFSIQGQLDYSMNLSISTNPYKDKTDFENDLFKIFSKQNILLTFNNQQETRKLQKRLIGISKNMIDFIINELRGCFRFIIKNINGNYFCSDLIKICNKDQRIEILKELSNTINEDCTDRFGNHTIQNLIELASNEEEFNLLLLSFNDFNKITVPALNQYGSHVIQKLIVDIPEKYRNYFNSIFVKFICILSKDMYGVYAVEKFINHTNNSEISKQFLNSILVNFIDISQNKFGNYLIQYLLEKWWWRKEGLILKKRIISKFEILSENQYSFFICSLFIKLCNNKEKKQLLFFLNNLKNKQKNNSFILFFIDDINNCLLKSSNENNNNLK